MAESQLVPITSKEVDIEGESFCLEFVPKTSTQLVQKEKGKLSAKLDLPGLVGDLHKLSNFVRVANYGVAGSTLLQIKVQRVGFTVAELCQESHVTVVLFKEACGDVLETLQSTYGYLTDGLDDIAIDNLKGLSEIAKRMTTASNNLMQKFEKAKNLVQITLESTVKEKGDQEKLKIEMQETQEEKKLEAEIEEEKQKAAKEIGEEKQKALIAAESNKADAEKAIDEVLARKRSFRHTLFRAVEKSVKYLSKEDTTDQLDHQIENERRRAKEAREERLQFLKEAEVQRAAQLEATLKLKDCVLRIQQAKTGEGVSDAAIAALHGAKGALSAITVIMMQATKFWRMMREHCDKMADDETLKLVEKSMTKPDEMRLKIWGSKSFITAGVRYYARWVALEDVCTTYWDEVRGAEKQMFLYMKEFPTTDEARKMVPALAEALKEDLQKAIEEMEKKSEEHKKEIIGTTKQIEDDIASQGNFDGAEKRMFLYMKEFPKTDEARKMVPASAEALKEDLQKAIGQLKKKSEDDKKEIIGTTKQIEDDI